MVTKSDLLKAISQLAIAQAAEQIVQARLGLHRHGQYGRMYAELAADVLDTRKQLESRVRQLEKELYNERTR